jgi:hypothetical protein
MKKINLIFVLTVAFALFVCASGVISVKTKRINIYAIKHDIDDKNER